MCSARKVSHIMDLQNICRLVPLPAAGNMGNKLPPSRGWMTSSKHQSVEEPVQFTLHEELPCRGDGKTAALATRVVLATPGAPPLEIFWSVSDKNSSEMF
ncbi:hypothetical protein P7K49_013544 [Saguinus oedipus]|uniref:Uncharacterized protein n=1 Tax=Saguinus oedipus TaxID=9490 RepID=A0ABQ9VG94_SAGOE|nr:hypothetical protein P7K49_013544 [Saguinus oedipus]